MPTDQFQSTLPRGERHQKDRASKVRSKFWINTDPELQREFKAACALQSKSVQATVNDFMRATVAETFAGFRPSEPA